MGQKEIKHDREILSQPPFIIMEDIVARLTPWAREHDFRLPRPTLIRILRGNHRRFLENYFPAVISLTEEELSSGLTSLTNKVITEDGLQPIFIDHVYTQEHPQASSLRLEIGRAINHEGKKIGYQPRPGFLPLEEQCRLLAERLPDQKNNLFLVDDTLVFGGQLKFAIRLLQEHGVRVKALCVAVASESAIDEFEEQGIKVHSCKRYNQFKDIVCEGDLYIGVSGLTVYQVGQSKDQTPIISFSAPYLCAYLKEDVLRDVIAVIPEAEADFFTFFTFQSVFLFEAIERASKKHVLRRDLPQIPTALSNPLWLEKRFVDDLWDNLEFIVGYQEYLSAQR